MLLFNWVSNITLCIHIQCSFNLKKTGPTTAGSIKSRIAGIGAQYQRYPKSEVLKQVAKEVVNKYPFLKHPSNGHVSEFNFLNSV